MGVVFFPRVTDELTKKARIDSANYQFFYEMEGKASALSAKRQGKMLALEDERDLWDLSQDGLLIEKVIDIDHPAVLFGENGVAPSDAYAALCIIWTCKALSQTGVIYPCSGEYGSEGVHVRFRHRFAPGTLKDDLTLEASLYLKTAACDVPEKEAHLMNEAGALLGSLEEPCQVNFKGNSMSFPMGEIDAPGDPLWWVEFSDWDDPRCDQFSEENVLLVLNKAHADYPSTNGSKTSGSEVLGEIFASALFLMLEKIRDFSDPEPWRSMMNNVAGDFEPGSICGVLHQVTRMDPEAEFAWGSSETRMMSLKRIVDRRMKGDL